MESIQQSLELQDGMFTAWFEIIFPKMKDWWQLHLAPKIA
jgi:hypothetical protein